MVLQDPDAEILVEILYRRFAYRDLAKALGSWRRDLGKHVALEILVPVVAQVAYYRVSVQRFCTKFRDRELPQVVVVLLSLTVPAIPSLQQRKHQNTVWGPLACFCLMHAFV